tara:strand:+ start:54 stop:563 length:510 start_codon:yes stop_codon:yes gene_type:complete
MSETSPSTKNNWTKTLWISGVLTLLAIISFPTLIIFIAGMLPTGVARICDRTRQKYATLCVGGLNICGVFPYIMQLWVDNHSVAAALNIISDLFALLVMYSSASIGWLMFIAIPPVVSTFLDVLAQRRVNALRNSQKDISEEWGTEVADKANKLDSAKTVMSPHKTDEQ